MTGAPVYIQEKVMGTMMESLQERAASVIFAAGKGSRMKGYEGNKTVLPLVSAGSIYEGDRPMLLEVLSNLPEGPKGIVVNHRAHEVRRATRGLDVRYLHQPETNGTGGALLAARPFLISVQEEAVVITMGDVPLIRSATYLNLLMELSERHFALLAFEPRDRAQYGMIETDGERPLGIVEWKYWSQYPAARQDRLHYCNAGVYAARRPVLLQYLEKLAGRPHAVSKERGGEWVVVSEFFLTDLVEMMSEDGLSMGMVLAPEEEVLGVDTPDSLARVQELYSRMAASRRSLQD